MSLDRQQKHFYLLLFLLNHTHLTILACFLLTTSSKRLLRIQIDIRIYKDYKWHKRGHKNRQIYLWRSYMCFLARLYILESTRSLKLSCIGIQTSIKVLCIQLQTIYHSAALNRSNGIVTSLALRMTKRRGITFL